MFRSVRAWALRFLSTIVWSLDGWRAAWQSEVSLRQWTAVNLVSAGFALVLPLSPAERAAILGLGLVVLAAELVNTALEEISDWLSEAEHPRAKKIKDCGSAGVALCVLALVAAWLSVLWGMWGASM